MSLGRWAHLGHNLGECWSDNRLTFIHIPKNASSSVKGFLINHRFRDYNTLQDTPEYFVVLRDPIERWLSGMAEYQINSNNLNMPNQEIIDTITFDDHTELQTYFLQNLPIENKTIFLKCDVNFTYTLNKFLMSRGYSEVRNPHTFNASEGKKLEIKESLRMVLDAIDNQ